MAQILCSTEAVIHRVNNFDYTLLLPLSRELSCDGFEFMMYNAWYDKYEAIIDFLKANNIATPVFHCDKHIGEYISIGTKENLYDAFSRFEINCKIASELGADKMVVHLWGGPDSDRDFDCIISAYKKLADIAKGCSFEFLVENVVCNRGKPLEHLSELSRINHEIGFTYDTKMAAFHSEDTLIYEEEYSWL